jgi:hypothetical protein
MASFSQHGQPQLEDQAEASPGGLPEPAPGQSMGDGGIAMALASADEDPVAAAAQNTAQTPSLAYPAFSLWTRVNAEARWEARGDRKCTYRAMHDALQKVRRYCSPEPKTKIPIDLVDRDTDILACFSNLVYQSPQYKNIFQEEQGVAIKEVFWAVLPKTDENEQYMQSTPFETDLVVVHSNGTYIRLHPKSRGGPIFREGQASDWNFDHFVTNERIAAQ